MSKESNSKNYKVPKSTLTTSFWITTFDNPWDPYENFDEWFAFDSKHHKTCELLGRISYTSNQLNDEENDEEIENALNQILKYDVECKYKRVYPKDT